MTGEDDHSDQGHVAFSKWNQKWDGTYRVHEKISVLKEIKKNVFLHNSKFCTQFRGIERMSIGRADLEAEFRLPCLTSNVNAWDHLI